MDELQTYTAFKGNRLLVRGNLQEVAIKIKKHLGSAINSDILLISDASGKLMDINFQGTQQEVLKRLEPYISSEEAGTAGGPGRPKLGVVSREISLLPRHWEWLASQPGGASATIRTLVEEARKKSLGTHNLKSVQERVYKVMALLAGDAQGYEEALRALYKRDKKVFLQNIRDWPQDVKSYIMDLSGVVFEN